MGGHRRPGPWGFGEPERIDAGTSCRAVTPAPGPVGVHEHNSNWPVARNLAAASLRQRESPSALQEIVTGLLGPQTFGLGVLVGITENVARTVTVRRTPSDLAG
jgi:hypothetical protein